ncbi:MAG: ribosome maturation factor RimP [Clostridiales bacterium]|nr:ribosome maturation factor RimP [Clostridiales bacterium]
MPKKKITEIATEELDSFLQSNGYELYGTQFVKEGRDWFLRIFIDWAEASGSRHIGTDDCEKVSRFLSRRLDELDPIEQNYYLEVSSPGLDRALRKEKDFAKYAGKEVEVGLYKAVNGRKAYSGTLKGLEDGEIVIIGEKGSEMRFPREQVAKAKLKIVL